jgi:hypothetical protein
MGGVEMSEMVRLIDEMIKLGWLYTCSSHGTLFFNNEDGDSGKEFRSWDEVAKFVEEEG